MVSDWPKFSEPRDRHTPHVLVVDDEAVIREEIVEYLVTNGLRAEAVSSGHDALDRLIADPSITALLSDIRMPEMDGLTLAAKAIEGGGEEHAVAVVLLTGHATVRDAASAIRMRATDFLEKPVALADVQAALLRAHAAAAERRAKWRDDRMADDARTEAQAQIDTLRSEGEELRHQLADSANPGTGQKQDGGREAFMSIMNHELRTPLVPIIGLAELIEEARDGLPPEQVRDYAREIRLGGQRLERALSRITEFTDLLAGQGAFNRTPARPDRILRAVWQTTLARLSNRQQTMTLDCRSPRALNTSPDRLQRLLEELVDNAGRFSPNDTVIALSVRDEGDGVAILVTDTGSGMNRAQIDLAFNAFRQVDMSLARRVDGLGIGLPIAMRIAHGLGGTLTIESEPDHGTTVTLHLPAACVLAPRS